MEIEAEIPFYEELKDLFDNKKSKKTLILWFHDIKRLNPSQVSTQTGYPRQTIYDTISKWENRGSIQDLSRSGQLCQTTMEEEKVIVQKQSDDRFKHITEICREVNDEGHELSYKQTRRVIKSNFHQASAPLRLQITKENMKKRVSLINEHTQWRKPKWKRVVWTDEKIFELHPQKGKLYAQLLEDETSEDFSCQNAARRKKSYDLGSHIWTRKNFFGCHN